MAVNRATELREVASWIAREERIEAVLAAAAYLVAHPDALAASDADGAVVPGVSRLITDLAMLAAPTVPGADEPVLVTRGVLRVARAYFGDERLLDRQNRQTDGRLGVARLIGGGDDARSAHLALMELAVGTCVLPRPQCGQCPLSGDCASVVKAELRSA